MEVGAVKQAFNNELIRLKKSLNQAKIQVIHKLTRKAKTLGEKKAPEKLKEKLKRKAESAVNEVLIIKKIKIRDLAKFMLTHTGDLNDFLNKPTVDSDKACARLLLHKTFNDKYKFIRNKFASVPINDLLMSREERRKLKKEAREQQKNKRKGKDSKVAKVDEEEMTNSTKEKEFSGESDLTDGEDEGVNDIDDETVPHNSDSEAESVKSDEDMEMPKEKSDSSEESEKLENNDLEIETEDKKEVDTGKIIEKKPVQITVTNIKKPTAKTFNDKPKQIKEKLAKKKPKDLNKNKNLKEKLLTRKFNQIEESVITENKVVDPFFVTATGENYLSVAEPRQPDEFKEIHRQGNRKLRRAVMFGHRPNIKPHYNDFNQNDRFDKSNNFRDNTSDTKRNNRFNNDKFNNYNERNMNKGNFNERIDKNNVSNKKKFEDQTEAKPEKLHPSWEAKKKQSGILPFQGKKIVFDDS